MFSNMKIGVRIALGFAVVLIVTIAVITTVQLAQFGDLIRNAEQRELRSMYEDIAGRIKAEERLAAALAGAVAHLGGANQSFAERDRTALESQMAPVYDFLSKEFGVRQFQYHVPPATSFLRLHRPEKHGDDLSGFRKTVVAVNENVAPERGLEKGVAGLGIRGVTPVRYAGEHVGSVEFGMSFGQSFFERIKEQYADTGMELALYVRDDEGFAPFARTYGDIRLLDDGLLDRAMNDPVLEARRLDGEPLSVYASRVTDYSGKPVGVLEIAIDRSYYQSAQAGARNSTLLIGLVALGAGMLIALFITRSISRPLNRAVTAMNDIAEGEGDLTRRLDTDGRDEIAQLGDAFNRFAEKVQHMVSQVAGSTSQLAAASEEMSTITNQSNQAIQRQQSETEQVVTAINEMAATVQEVARNAESAANSAHQADEQSKGGRQVVDETISAIRTLADEVERASEAINQLGQDSENIGSVLDVIRDIADQTNLLALNAAIEAARAGEQGRGFAVVADEVRTLASRTQDSTQEIQEMIERLQGGARNAVSVMESGRSQAQSSVEQAGRAGEALSAITTAVASISDMNSQIASAAEEQSAVAEEINRNIVAINEITDQTAEGAQQTATSSDELARLASELQNLVNQFKY